MMRPRKRRRERTAMAPTRRAFRAAQEVRAAAVGEEGAEGEEEEEEVLVGKRRDLYSSKRAAMSRQERTLGSIMTVLIRTAKVI